MASRAAGTDSKRIGPPGLVNWSIDDRGSRVARGHLFDAAGCRPESLLFRLKPDPAFFDPGSRRGHQLPGPRALDQFQRLHQTRDLFECIGLQLVGGHLSERVRFCEKHPNGFRTEVIMSAELPCDMRISLPRHWLTEQFTARIGQSFGAILVITY